jgi:hypothetical protein
MNKKGCGILFLLFIPFLLFSSFEKGIEEEQDSNTPEFTIGNQYALLIGINEYTEWLPLQNPVADMKEIKSILKSRYLIDSIIELYDDKATKANILRTFEMLQTRLKPEDSLFIIYSGHGFLDNKTKTGFWIPVDAGRDVYKQENWLSTYQIRGLIANMLTNHILLLVDSCFSGNIIEGNRGIRDINTYFTKAYNRMSRFVITSSALEMSPDNSEFAEQLKYFLQQNDQPYIDALTLFHELRNGMKRTLPIFGGLKDAGHQEGSCFLFFLKKAEGERGSFRVKRLPGSTTVEEKKSWITGMTGTFTFPLLYVDKENILSSPGSGELFFGGKLGKISLLKVYIMVSANYTYLTSSKNSLSKNILHCIHTSVGMAVYVDFPFHFIPGIHFSLVGGPGFIIRENKIFNETSFSIKPGVTGNAGIHYHITDTLTFIIKTSVTILADSNNFSDWYKGIGCGGGISFQF